jgi:aspartate racemase
MGPQASLEMHKKLIKAAARAGAQDNDDFPEILHVSIPVPDFISSGEKAAALERLKKTLKTIKFKPSDRIVIACNTVHILLPELEAYCGIKFVSMIDLTVKAASNSKAGRIGLLASPTTIESKLYELPLLEAGIKSSLPNKKESLVLESAIRRVIAGEEPSLLQAKLEPILFRMEHDGANKLILGCTELSLILRNSTRSNLLDPLDLACKHLIKV